GGLTPKICSTVGATSTFPDGVSLTIPFLKSGPAARSVLCKSNGLILTCVPFKPADEPGFEPSDSEVTKPAAPLLFVAAVQRKENATSGECAECINASSSANVPSRARSVK